EPDVVPAVRLHPDLVPEVLAVVDGVGRVAVAEAVVPLGPGIERALDRQFQRLAVPLLALLVDRAMVDDVVLVDRPGPWGVEEVVALLRGDLGGGDGVEAGGADVVDDDLGVVLLAPLLDVGAVEPNVIAGDEVIPLEDPQLLPAAQPVDAALDAERRADACGACELQQLAPGDSASHGGEKSNQGALPFRVEMGTRSTTGRTFRVAGSSSGWRWRRG